MSKWEKKFFDSPWALVIMPLAIGLIGLISLGTDNKPRTQEQKVAHRLEK
ncbi:MAG: hypothetical protein M3Q73_04335 [bacterium]|nr:hypothetical protein [bacterium]